MTAAVGWAVVGPRGKVYWETARSSKALAKGAACARDFASGDAGDMRDGYRLVRVRIEVIEESDDARGGNDGR